MLRHLRRLLVSLSVVVAAWWLYALCVVPWVDPQVRRREPLEPPELDQAEPSSLTQTVFRAQLEALFPAGSWELGDPNVLETDQGVFLFREYHDLPDHRFEIKPCTLVAFSKPKAPQNGSDKPEMGRVIVLQAPQGAQLQFDDASDVSRFRFGKLLGGRLPGEIHIWSREPNGGQPLNLKTRNIQIEERRIWTPHEVLFEFGASHGRGRDLEIHLQRTVAADDDAPAAAGTSKVGSAMGNLQSVELVHLDELHLEGLTDPGASADKNDGAAPRTFGDGPLDVRCRGPVRLNVVDLVATLEDQVSVTHRGPNGSTDADRLQCDLLTVVLRQQLPAPAGAAAPPAKQPRFEVERLIAAGSNVELSAPSQRASAQGQRLEINVPARRLRLEGTNGATLAHETMEISAVNLEYELAAERGAVGRAWAQGPGRLKAQFGSAQGRGVCEATWGAELQLRPHEGLHVVSLTGGAAVEYAGSGKFSADSLHLWLRPVPNATPGRPAFIPDRLLAQGAVSINAQQLLAKTHRVEAWFRDIDEATASDTSGAAPGRLASSGSGGGAGGFGLSTTAANGPARFEVNGDLVRVALLRTPGGNIGLEALEVTNQVVIRELGASTAGVKPLEIQGDRLRLEQTANGKGTLRVIGQPATVAARGMSLVGSEVQLDQATNRLRIPGAGEMTLPAFDLKPKPRAGVIYENPAALNAAASASTGKPTTVTWKNGLEFDGQTAVFQREVQVRASQRLATGEWLELVLIGGDLEVRLASRVLFAEHNGEAPSTSLEYLKFGGSVYLDGRTHQGDQLTSYERMQLRNLTLHQGTGKLVGEGPGWLTGARLDDGSFAAQSDPAAPANEPPTGLPPAAAPPRVLFLHVAFQRGLEGQLVDRQVEFIDRVRAVFAPVPNFETEVDPDRPDEWPQDAVELRCDRLSVAQHGGATPDTAAAELNATGNATVEGKKFGARAARISYSQAKDLLVLAGDGRAAADFWRKPRSQAKPDASANTIMYWRKNNRVLVNGVKYVDLNSLGQ